VSTDQNRLQKRSVVRRAAGVLLGATQIVVILAAASTLSLAQFQTPVSLSLLNGWTSQPFSTGRALVDEQNGIVQFRGAIATSGTNLFPFTLGTNFRPATDVYVPIDLCNATKGRLHITPAGSVDVETEGGVTSNAQCFTSLDGASFAPKTTGFTALTLVNGWTNAPFSTSNAMVKNINGIVHFKGAIASGTTGVAFTLPSGFRPSNDVYIPVDLCNAANGRLHITPSGLTDVETEGPFSGAQCFTSLDGAWFDISGGALRTLSLLNGWTNAPFSTANAQVGNAYGVVYFKGAIATSGSNAVPFILIPSYRPLAEVYVHIDLCGSTNGRLHITTDGTVTVETETGFNNAQCFTSLDGASFVQ